MEYVLVKTNYNWADEADFPSFEIMTKEELHSAKELTRAYFDNEDCYDVLVGVGTNEEIEFNNYQDVFSGVSITVLTEEEAKIIKNKIGLSYGGCPLSCVIENIEDAYNNLDHHEDLDNDKIEEHDL